MRKPSMIASLRLNNADWLICFRHFKDILHRAEEFTGFNIVLSNHMGGQHNKSEFVIQMITMVDWCIRASPRMNRSKRTGRYRIHDEYFFQILDIRFARSIEMWFKTLDCNLVFVTEVIAVAAATVRVSLSKIDFDKTKGVTKSIQMMFEEAQAKYVLEEIEVNDHPNSFFWNALLGER